MTTKTDKMQEAIRQSIRAIPKGKVATYGQVAAAAGLPRGHRQVAQVLHYAPTDSLPWHRVIGAGGQLKTQQEWALEQRFRLEMEGVRFRGARVDLRQCQSPLHDPTATAGKRRAPRRQT